MWLRCIIVILVCPVAIYSHGKLISRHSANYRLHLHKSTHFTEIRRPSRSAFSIKFVNVTEKISSVEKPSVRNKNPRIAFSKTSDLTPIASNLFRCPKSKSDVECANKTAEFKSKVLQELTKSVSRRGEDNIYSVSYHTATNRTGSSPLCALLGNKIKLLRKKDSPFNENKLGQLFPKHKLFRKSKGKSCIIVSSAGSLTGSTLGGFIGEIRLNRTVCVGGRAHACTSLLVSDSHDIVMRFNHAPTEGYESDVGSKTSIRIVNSQARRTMLRN